MRFPVSPYGIKELVTFSGGFLLISVAAWIFIHPVVALAPLALALFVAFFFRDPPRKIPPDRGDLLAPADGTIADIAEVDDPLYLGGRALRIGIFLSVFDVHMNRAPCTGRVEKVDYRKGRFHDARHPAAGQENEALTMSLFCPQHDLRVVVRQISGAIARRIVFRLAPGALVERGERYGMIKFGSRTELLVPAERVAALAVAVGSKVRAGTTVVARIGR